MVEPFSQIGQCPKASRLFRRGERIEKAIFHSERVSQTVEFESRPAFEPLRPTMPEVAQPQANTLLRFKQTIAFCSLGVLLTALLPQIVFVRIQAKLVQGFLQLLRFSYAGIECLVILGMFGLQVGQFSLMTSNQLAESRVFQRVAHVLENGGFAFRLLVCQMLFADFL